MPKELISIYHRLQNCFSPAKKRCSSNNIIIFTHDGTQRQARQSHRIYHNSRCTYPLKRPQSLSDAKNTKRQGNTRPNQKNASGSFLEGCITMHKIDSWPDSLHMNTERVKTANFLIQKTVNGMRKNFTLSEFFSWNARISLSAQDVRCGTHNWTTPHLHYTKKKKQKTVLLTKATTKLIWLMFFKNFYS